MREGRLADVGGGFVFFVRRMGMGQQSGGIGGRVRPVTHQVRIMPFPFDLNYTVL